MRLPPNLNERRAFQGCRAVVMGLGRHGGGAAAARYLAEHGAAVTVTDLADATALAEPLATLADAGIQQFHLGGHREADFRNAELVVVNPAVKPDNRWVELVRQAGGTITSEIELFLNACPAPVIGVTGTSGKSTTATMTAAILSAAFCTADSSAGQSSTGTAPRVWLGGNIGVSLLPNLPRISPDDCVVLELSSFQLFWLNETTRWPAAAVVTNCSPNHLDWHGSMEHYAAAKQRLLTHVGSNGMVVFDAANPEFPGWAELSAGRWTAPLTDRLIPPLGVPGEHNRRNAACAAAIALAAGANLDAVRRGLASFKGLPHRLEKVAIVAGRTFINDSKSTTPSATIVALDAVDKPIWLLLGGADKGVDLRPLVSILGRRTSGVAVFGAVGKMLDSLLNDVAPQLPHAHTETLEEALAWCWTRSRPGDTILLSPACASLDQFRDFTERGGRFAAWVARLAASGATIGVV